MPNDPHGAADSGDDLDLDLTGAVAPKGSPLGAAASALRGGTDDAVAALLDDDGTEDDLDEPIGDEIPEGAEDGEPAAEEAPEDEEPEDEEPEAEPEGAEEEGAEEEERPAGKTFDLTIPPVAKTGPNKGISFTLEGLPQEVRDTLQAHLKRSADLDFATEQIEDLRQHEAVAQFLLDQPVSAFAMLAMEDADKGDQGRGIGRQFVELWLRTNPEPGIQLMKKLHLDDPDVDRERLADRAESARLKLKDTVREGLAQQGQTTKRDRLTKDVVAVTRAVMDEMQLRDQDRADFAAVVSTRVQGLYKSRIAKGRDPFLTRNEVLSVVQSAAQRFVARDSTPKGKAGKSSALNLAEQFERKRAVAATHRKVGGGMPTGSRVRPAALKKLKGAKGVSEAAKALRSM